MSKRLEDLTDEEWDLIMSRISDNLGFDDDFDDDEVPPDTLLHFNLARTERGADL